jgi:hypothetical protein
VKATLLFRRRVELSSSAFAELVLWSVPSPVRGSKHGFKYSFALVADEICVMRYDNEAGKGDHVHEGGHEYPYRFIDAATLLMDFVAHAERWLHEHRND